MIRRRNVSAPHDETAALRLLHEWKHAPCGSIRLPGRAGGAEYEMLLLTADQSENLELMHTLGRWREQNGHWFPAVFPVTLEGTCRWYRQRVIDAEQRLLFLLQTPAGPVGHVGLDRLRFAERAYDLDNILRGEGRMPGVMHDAIARMIGWAERALGIGEFGLDTVLDNERALRLYHRLGFEIVERYPLEQRRDGDRMEWSRAARGSAAERWGVRLERRRGLA